MTLIGTVLSLLVVILAEDHFVVIWMIKVLSVVMSHFTLVTILAGGLGIKRTPGLSTLTLFRLFGAWAELRRIGKLPDVSSFIP